MQKNNEETVQREDVVFVNALLQEMNVWHFSHPEKVRQTDSAVKKLQDFAGFLYEHLGVKAAEAAEEAKGFAALGNDGKAIMLKLFSASPNNPATAMTLASPDAEVKIRLAIIMKKFYELCPNPDRDGTTLEGKLADRIACYAQETAMLQRQPGFKREFGGIPRDPTLLIIAQLKGERDRAREKLEQNPGSKIAQITLETASNNLKAIKQTSRGLFATISPAERRLELLQECVYRGDLSKVEDMLNNTPELALHSRSLTDLSKREFPAITVLQYAAWALDKPMQALIKRYLPDASIKEQLAQLNNPKGEIATQHGTHFSFDEVLTRMDEYLKNYDALFTAANWEELANIIYNGIGGAQRNYPAWLILTMCEEGEDAAWANLVKGNKEAVNQEVKRDMKHLTWWFERNWSDEEGHIMWHALRGENEQTDFCQGGTGDDKVVALDRQCLADFKSSQSPEPQSSSQLLL